MSEEKESSSQDDKKNTYEHACSVSAIVVSIEGSVEDIDKISYLLKELK